MANIAPVVFSSQYQNWYFSYMRDSCRDTANRCASMVLCCSYSSLRVSVWWLAGNMDLRPWSRKTIRYSCHDSTVHWLKLIEIHFSNIQICKLVRARTTSIHNPARESHKISNHVGSNPNQTCCLFLRAPPLSMQFPQDCWWSYRGWTDDLAPSKSLPSHARE